MTDKDELKPGNYIVRIDDDGNLVETTTSKIIGKLSRVGQETSGDVNHLEIAKARVSPPSSGNDRAVAQVNALIAIAERLEETNNLLEALYDLYRGSF